MKKSERSLADVLNNDAKLDETVREAVRQAIEANRRRKNRMAAWDGERVVVIEPDEPDAKAKSPNP